MKQKQQPRPASATALAAAAAPQAAPVVRLSPQPMYAQIKEELRRRILDGTYQPHQQLPSEAELMAAFDVSRITVRQALSDLQGEGLIFKIHGKGTFVSKPKAFQELGQLEGFGEAMGRHGHETYNKLVSLRTLKAPASVAERLALPAGSSVTEIRRVRLLNREPISLDVSWFDRSIGEKLKRADLAQRDIFSILENQLAQPLGQAELRIEAILADEMLAELLKVQPGSPVLKMDRLTYTQDGRPIDYEHLYYRGDAFQYRLRIDRAGTPARG